MEANRRYHNEFEYFEGNTVRKLKAVPDYNREQHEYERRRQQVRRNTRKEYAMGIDLFSLLFLTAAIIITMYVCVEYLRVQSNITSMSKKIVSMETKVIEMKNHNEMTLEQVTGTIDLAHIYEVATNELGMVHANHNQVITYTNVKSNYVRQYGEIPSIDKSDFLDYIIRKK